TATSPTPLPVRSSSLFGPAQPGRSALSLRTVEERRHLGCVLCSLSTAAFRPERERVRRDNTDRPGGHPQPQKALSILHGHSAVYIEYLPGDIPRLIRRQECHCICDILCLSEFPQRDLCDRAF